MTGIVLNYSIDMNTVGGEIITILLVILLLISLLLFDSKYMKEFSADTLDICSKPLLLVFMVIITFKVFMAM